MLYAKEIPSPTGKAKWTRAAADHLLSNPKCMVIVGLETFLDAQFEKSVQKYYFCFKFLQYLLQSSQGASNVEDSKKKKLQPADLIGIGNLVEHLAAEDVI